mmetsp:Transcript_17625/g.42361  ORF Transcript_17625/g.42361 Transcript_17625/m.42361 type:complete len:131 (-) Transcript_17625:694-1086(-)
MDHGQEASRKTAAGRQVDKRETCLRPGLFSVHLYVCLSVCGGQSAPIHPSIHSLSQRDLHRPPSRPSIHSLIHVTHTRDIYGTLSLSFIPHHHATHSLYTGSRPSRHVHSFMSTISTHPAAHFISCCAFP